MVTQRLFRGPHFQKVRLFPELWCFGSFPRPRRIISSPRADDPAGPVERRGVVSSRPFVSARHGSIAGGGLTPICSFLQGSCPVRQPQRRHRVTRMAACLSHAVGLRAGGGVYTSRRSAAIAGNQNGLKVRIGGGPPRVHEKGKRGNRACATLGRHDAACFSSRTFVLVPGFPCLTVFSAMQVCFGHFCGQCLKSTAFHFVERALM